MKFSIIVPIYNVESYLDKCLDSILNQTYKDYEVLLINDGSTDNSKSICLKYIEKDKRFNYIEKVNGGLSSARNKGIELANGEYLLFVDSDDYLDINLLKTLNDNLDDDYDLIRFQVNYDKDNKIIKTIGSSEIKRFNKGLDAFNEIVNYEIVEAAWCYLYNRNYFVKNKFLFKEGFVHEDYGLIPLIIIKASKVKVIDFYGYYYVIRDNSIMTNNDYDKVVKKANDFLEHFKYLLKETNNIKEDLSIFKSFIANSIIIKSTTLKGNDYKYYLKELKRLNTFDLLLDDTISRKIKKCLLKISPKIYYKIVRG